MTGSRAIATAKLLLMANGDRCNLMHGVLDRYTVAAIVYLIKREEGRWKKKKT